MKSQLGRDTAWRVCGYIWIAEDADIAELPEPLTIMADAKSAYRLGADTFQWRQISRFFMSNSFHPLQDEAGEHDLLTVQPARHLFKVRQILARKEYNLLVALLR